jgi:GH25 family lysozyme M1 (1,4-beta-N-acetylmuramidase)
MGLYPGDYEGDIRMIIKQPLVVDVAYNNEIVDWKKVKADGQVMGAVCKASEGWLIEDPYVKYNWPGIAEAGLPRAAYHFYRYQYPSAWQAKKFVNTLNKYGGFLPNDRLVLDEEEPGHMSISAMIDFTYNVEILSGISHKNMWWYSWPWALNELSFRKLSPAQVQYVMEIPTWVAGYPNNPDLYTDPIKAGYKVDLTRFGKSVGWQYAESVIIPNIPGGTDVNWMDADYLASWTGTPVVVTPQPVNSVSFPQYPGVIFDVYEDYSVKIR